jgi:septal ring factor EnvC (AmiA/AmiB activator)
VIPLRRGLVPALLGAALALLSIGPAGVAAPPPSSTIALPPATPSATPGSPPSPAPHAAAPTPPAAAPPAPPKPKTTTAAPKPVPPKPPANPQLSPLDMIRQQSIADAHVLQQRERAVNAVDVAVNVMQRSVAAKQKEFEQSRGEEEQLLGALERLARAPPEALALSPEGPVERLRSGILIAAAVPALAAQARDLSGELTALAAVRTRLDARRGEIDAARLALAKARDALDQLVAKRNDLIAQLLHDDGKTPPNSELGDTAKDLYDLIVRADADTDRRDMELVFRLHAVRTAIKGAQLDPTRPKSPHSFDTPQAVLTWPVMGGIVGRFGEAGDGGEPRQGLAMEAPPRGVVVGPFDGRVAYVGKLRGYGLILIIRHGGGYHSVLAGLGQTSVTVGQWLLAGEPVATLADVTDGSASATLIFELRREGRAVDPQPRLAARDEKLEDSKVRR